MKAIPLTRHQHTLLRIVAGVKEGYRCVQRLVVRRVVLGALLLGLTQSVSAVAPFQLIDHGVPAHLSYLGKDVVVNTAIELLQEDVQLVCGRPFSRQRTLKGRTVLVGMPAQERVFRDMMDRHGVDFADVLGRWEAFKLVQATIKGQPCLCVIGSDSRGTAYGVLELSRILGVSPWVWWADVTPTRRSQVAFVADGKVHAPSVQYRGIFLNDEDWGLMPWASKTYEPGPKGQIGPNTYARIFELLLRLRANTIWPAMHEVTVPFYQVAGNDEMTRRYGIVVGTSHCEPLLYNSAGEWDEAAMGRYNFLTNQEKVVEAWTRRLKQVAGNRNHFFTIGMRGKHDGRMEGVSTNQAYKEALEKVIRLQRQLLSTYVHPDPTQVPQAFIPYKEVLEVYDMGLNVPDDVTLIWCDDNYGYLTRLSNPDEQTRKGGAGVYYHISYWGRPHDYLWLASTPPAQLHSELRKAWEYRTRKLWIVNVGDIKPGEYLTELFLDMAWDMEALQFANLHEHLERWAGREFGHENAQTIAAVMQAYYQRAAECKPEHMGWNAVELSKQRNPRGLSPVTDTEYNPFLFGDQIKQRLDAYTWMVEEVDRIKSSIPAARLDAYFQLVEYPVKGAALKNRQLLLAQKARLYARFGLPVADDYAQMSLSAYDAIEALTDQYNNSLREGKWRGMMDMAPRKLPVFERDAFVKDDNPVGGHPGLQGKHTVVFWPENLSHPITDTLIQVPAFVKERPQPFFVSLFSTGEDAINQRVEHLPDWLRCDTVFMGVKGEKRLVFSADFVRLGDRLPAIAQCTVHAGERQLCFRFEARSYGRTAAGYEVNGLVALNAADYTGACGATPIPGYGHSGRAMALQAASNGLETNAPRLTYDVLTMSTGNAEVRLYVLPTRPMNGGDLRIAVSIDGGEPQVRSFKTEGRSTTWMHNVLRNQAIVTVKHDFQQAGRHTIQVFTPDRDVVVDQLAVEFQPDRSYYVLPVVSHTNNVP